jgi:hypothetical protein
VVADTWTRVSFTVAVPTTAVTGIAFSVLPNGAINGGSAGIVFITGVQLEAGSVATPFKRNANSIQGELAACQRYYQKYDTPQNHTNSTGYLESATTARTSFPLAVPMRAAPTFTITGTFGIIANGVLYTVTYLNANFVENASFIRQSWTGTGMPGSHACALRHNGTAEFSAEL